MNTTIIISRNAPIVEVRKNNSASQWKQIVQNFFNLDVSNYNKDFKKLGIIDFICN